MKGIYTLLHESAVKNPNRPFIQNPDRVWTYYDALNMVRRFSECLLERGIEKGDRIILFCDNSIQYVTAFFGIMKSSAVAVPINPAKMTESILYIIEKCTPKLIISCNSTAERLSIMGDGQFVQAVDVLNIDHLHIIDATCPASSLPVAWEPDLDETDKNDNAEILFTSGTTATPKGVTLTHGNLIANTSAVVDYLRLTCEDSVLMTLPFTYSYGNSVLLTHALTGAAVVIENSAAFPYRVLEDIKKYNVTGFSTVGSYANLILKCIRTSETDQGFFGSLRYITFAGEATHIDDLKYIGENFPGIEVFVMYGQTEASARLSYLSPELLLKKLGSVGKGLCNVELRVVDETGTDIKPGALGEIIAHGPNIMKGYWEDQTATQEVLNDGWLFTGDTATVDEDGYIYIKGRKSDMIKHMGHRISPMEIENVINRCANIRECAVINSALDRKQIIKAFIVLEKECPVEDVKYYTYSKLPVYMRPHIFEVTDQLPKTESGKIRRSALRGAVCVELQDS